MEFWILDDTLRISIKYEKQDRDLNDNINLSIFESCPEDEKLFLADETNIFLTPDEAGMIAEALLNAIRQSRENHTPGNAASQGYNYAGHFGGAISS